MKREEYLSGVSFFKKFSTGFTIIELIVVIAIIAVLAAIVLTNVTKYQTASKNTAIKGNLATLATRGVKYFEDSSLGNGGYSSFCSSASGGGPINTAIANAGGTDYVCATSPAKWCACAKEIAGATITFCVDSSGYKKETSNACSSIRCINGIGEYFCHD